MSKAELEKYIIEKYKQDEQMMVLIFAQWCVNHDLDARRLYEIAYPEQGENQVLQDAIKETVSIDESDEIDAIMVIEVLQAFGNDDLAFVVQQMADELDDIKKSKE